MSILWTGLSRIFYSIEPVGYDAFFATTSTIFWHAILPMTVTFIVFIGLMIKWGKVKQIYSQNRLSFGNGIYKWFGYLVIVGMAIFIISNFDTNFNSIPNHFSKAAIQRVFVSLIATAVVAVLEESVFRGFVLTEVRKNHSELTAFITSSVLFGLWHLPNLLNGGDLITTLAQVIFTMFLGSTLYVSLRTTKSISVPMVIHCLWDFVLVIA
ncbi:type II CAAX endopeptidase family protein [Fructilactobacillus vespulae]|uniref:CPBP family intramembrane glutamic endopeptidase n=1 Tax=Fructilactobacillus vespulae TaxID=1249630 RepID=UPI0039B5CE23